MTPERRDAGLAAVEVFCEWRVPRSGYAAALGPLNQGSPRVPNSAKRQAIRPNSDRLEPALPSQKPLQIRDS